MALQRPAREVGEHRLRQHAAQRAAKLHLVQRLSDKRSRLGWWWSVAMLLLVRPSRRPTDQRYGIVCPRGGALTATLRHSPPLTAYRHHPIDDPQDGLAHAAALD